MKKQQIIRCNWCENATIYQQYHDEEWGRPEFDSLKLFECLCLEGQQAGLSWITVLKKRENYRAAFHQFDPNKIALMSEQDLDNLMQNSGLIRHRAKLDAIVKNAKAYVAMEKCGQNFSHFLWAFVGHQPKINDVPNLSCVPANTLISQQMSKALKKKGFVFVGETTCYAFMQAVGMVDDHVNDCFYKHKA
ncbi:MAG: DNA-3-methyladenine glycosylase I [Lonepinella koalarum]|nr:DNA-3-methyladenine glycosylase I [Lonepinella koalarum]